MAVHLENAPGRLRGRELLSVLIEQIDCTYSAEVSSWLRRGLRAIKDPVLALLTPEGVPQDSSACSRYPRLFESKPRTPDRALRTVRMSSPVSPTGSWSPAPSTMRLLRFIVDLAVWYHLAWLGETVRLGDPRVAELTVRGRHFSAEECRQLLEIVGEILSGLVPRYRRLMGSGRVELSVTPYGHPIVPS